MNITIEERMESIEQQLVDLKKELDESLARYKNTQYPFTNGDVSKLRSGSIRNIPETKCLWDSIPLADRYQPMGLSCPCRKCSAYS